jgi:hypothetical protein
VKPATEPAPGETVETRTVRRIVPASEFQTDSKSIDVWDYLPIIAEKDARDWESKKRVIYLSRIEPTPPLGLGKTVNQYFTMPNGQMLNLGDRDEVELEFTRQLGGGVFRIIVKEKSQWVSQGKISINMPVRDLSAFAAGQQASAQSNGSGNGAHVVPISGDATATVAGRAFDALATQERNQAAIGFEAMRTTVDLNSKLAETISRLNGPSNQPPSEMDQAFRMMQLKMFEKMLDRMDAPQPTGFPGLNGDMVGRFFSTVIERGLNPPVATNGGSVSGVAAVASVLPQVLSYGAQIAAEIRMKAEAERDTVIAARSPQPPQVQPPQPRPQVLPPSTPTPAPNPNGANNMGAPSIEFIETRIIQILQQPISADEAADAVLMYLHTTDGPEVKKGDGSVEQLAKLGENGLVQLFQFRPKLKPATGNMPRLLEFIRAFLKLYAEDQEGEQQPPVAPPLAN